MDNASSNDTTVVCFKNRMNAWGKGVENCAYIHMRCIAHVLNLVVNDGLKDMDESTLKVRDCVRYIRNSPQRLDKFKELAGLVGIESQKSLCLDVPTRWNSTFLMLETACIFQTAFEKYDEEESSFRSDLNDNIPDAVDWLLVKKFTECLHHFYLATVSIFGSLYITSNMHFQEIYELHLVLKDMSLKSDFEIRHMAEKMKSKFISIGVDFFC